MVERQLVVGVVLAEQRREGVLGQTLRHFEREGQHIGGLVLAPVFPVQGLDFRVVDHPQGDVADHAAGHAVTGYPARLDFYPPDVYVAPKLDVERAAGQQHAILRKGEGPIT